MNYLCCLKEQARQIWTEKSLTNEKAVTNMNSTFLIANLRMDFSISLRIAQEGRLWISFSTTSIYIYEFTCFLVADYIEQTTRYLGIRIKEHHLTLLNIGVTKSIISSVVWHLLDTGDIVYTIDAFSVVYKLSTRLPQIVCKHILSNIEVFFIHLQKLTLYQP